MSMFVEIFKESKEAQKKLFKSVWKTADNEPNLYFYSELKLEKLQYAFGRTEDEKRIYPFSIKDAWRAADACIEVLYERYNQPESGFPPVGLTRVAMCALNSMLNYFVDQRDYAYIKKIEKVVDDIPYAFKKGERFQYDGKVIASRWIEGIETNAYNIYYDKIKAKSWYYLKDQEKNTSGMQDNHERTVCQTSNTQSLQEKHEERLKMLREKHEERLKMLEQKHEERLKMLEEKHKRNMQMINEKYGRNM